MEINQLKRGIFTLEQIRLVGRVRMALCGEYPFVDIGPERHYFFPEEGGYRYWFSLEPRKYDEKLDSYVSLIAELREGGGL